MYCLKCGKKQQDGSRFCMYCGYKFENVSELDISKTEDGSPCGDQKATSAVDNLSSTEAASQNQMKKPRSKKKFAIPASITVAVIAVLIVGFLWMKNDSLYADFYRAFTADEVVYENGERYVTSEVLLTADDSTHRRAVEKLVNAQGGKIVGYIGVSNDYQIHFTDGKTYDELQSIIELWTTSDGIESVSLNYVNTEETESIDYSGDPWQSTTPTNENYLENSETEEQWNLFHPGGSNWWAEALGMPSVWNLDIEWQTVKVGIYDTMFDETNEDLQDAFAKNGLYQNPTDVSSEYQALVDAAQDTGDASHGTHVAGIIGARTNGFGIAGVSQNSELYGFASKADKDFNYVSDMELKYGIAVLLSNGVKVINRSMTYRELGVSAQYDAEELNLTEENSAALSELSRMRQMLSSFLAKCLEEYDFLIVVSAGNTNGQIWMLNDNLSDEHPLSCVQGDTSKDKDKDIGKEWSSDYEVFSKTGDENVDDHIVIVGALAYTNNNGDKYVQAPYNAVGAEIYAPGTDILSDYPTNFTAYKSGTSMAAPMVTGVAALVWGVNPDLSALEVKDILIKSAENNPWSSDMVSALNAVCYALKTLGEERERASTSENSVALGFAYKTSPGIAEDADREIITDTTFRIYEAGNPDSAEEVSKESDGTFTLLLSAGEYVIEASADGYNSVTQTITVESGSANYIEIPMTMAATQVTSETYMGYVDDGTFKGYATITGLNDNGERCWLIQTDSYELIANSDMALPFDELGTDNGRYYYYDGGNIISVNIADGSQVWKTERLLSSTAATAFDENGTMFIACETIIEYTYYINGVEYEYPNFVAIDASGNVLAELMFSDRDYSITSMEYESGKVRIYVSSDTVIVINTSDYSYEEVPFASLGFTAEGEAYREFIVNEEYSEDMIYYGEKKYAVYDVNNDGTKELILHLDPTNQLLDGIYYIYGFSGAQVTEIGSCDNMGREGTYYSAAENAFVIVSLGAADFMTYEFYQVNSQLNLMFELFYQYFGPGMGEITEENTLGYLIYTFTKTDANGVEENITKAEYNKYIDSLVEIEFIEFP